MRHLSRIAMPGLDAKAEQKMRAVPLAVKRTVGFEKADHDFERREAAGNIGHGTFTK